MLPPNEIPPAAATDSPEIPNMPETPNSQAKTLRSKLLGGSLTLLASSGLVGITNFAYNVATARLLGPTGFANATAVYTLLMLMSAITLTYQVVAAKFVAKSATLGEQAAVFRTLHWKAWLTGASICVLLLAFRSAIAAYLNLPRPNLIVLLAIGTLFYIPLGVRRGYIQGTHAFDSLAINFILEGLVRLGGAVVLIRLGWGVQGAVLASVAAVIVSYFSATLGPGRTPNRPRSVPIPFEEGLQAIVFFAGQVVINNFDILLVKHFFPSDMAGVYAAVSLVGRVVNMCAWSVVNTMFPVSASVSADKREARPILLTSLVMVLVILCVFIAGIGLIPSFLWRLIFGAHLGQGTYGGLTSLLVLYAVTAGIYSLSSVMITHEMSRKIANTSWAQLAFSGLLILGVCLFHNNLREVIIVQLVLVVIMLVVVALPLLHREVGEDETTRYRRLKILRRLSEQEVIAFFLKSEFHHPEFEEYQQFWHLLAEPDFDNERENALRRALLFLRRGPMWRELPEDTQWFQVQLGADDLARVRFFPRAQWRRVAQGSFYLSDMIESLRLKWPESHDDEFFQKLDRMTTSMRESLMSPTVLLIGLDRHSALTILDGNHRIAAAMLAQPPASLEKFQFICGLSPRMIRCCWYRTNVNTLWRYLKNLLRHFFYDPESDIGRFQEDL
jgi:O-antigen/teichoic acid export membrane protein